MPIDLKKAISDVANPVKSTTEAIGNATEKGVASMRKYPWATTVIYQLAITCILSWVIWMLFKGRLKDKDDAIANRDAQIVSKDKEIVRLNTVVSENEKEFKERLVRYDSVLNSRNETIYELYKSKRND